MGEKLEYSEIIGGNVGYDLKHDRLSLQFDLQFNGQVMKGRPMILSQQMTENVIFQLRHALDQIRQIRSD